MADANYDVDGDANQHPNGNADFNADCNAYQHANHHTNEDADCNAYQHADINADGDANFYIDRHPDVNANINADHHTDINADQHTDINADEYADRDADANPYVHTDSNASSRHRKICPFLRFEPERGVLHRTNNDIHGGSGQPDFGPRFCASSLAWNNLRIRSCGNTGQLRSRPLRFASSRQLLP